MKEVILFARYSPFAEDLTMMSDISTIAVALPGYSKKFVK